MKARTCNQAVAAAIQKFGLEPVRAAVEMAVVLSAPNLVPKRRSTGAGKTRVAAAVVGTELPERFDR